MYIPSVVGEIVMNQRHYLSGCGAWSEMIDIWCLGSVLRREDDQEVSTTSLGPIDPLTYEISLQ